MRQFGILEGKIGGGYYHIYQKNAGQAAAVNKGLKFFQGDYLMWLDSDDILLKDNIERKVEFLEHNPDYGIVLCNYATVLEEDTEKYVKVNTIPKSVEISMENCIDQKFSNVGQGTILVRSEAFNQVFPKREIIESPEGQNWQLMLPLLYYFKCGYLQEVLFLCVKRADSHSHIKMSYQRYIERQYNFEKLIIDILSGIPDLPESELQAWKTTIGERYAKRRLKRAYEEEKESDVKKYITEVQEARRQAGVRLTKTYMIIETKIELIKYLTEKIISKVRNITIASRREKTI